MRKILRRIRNFVLVIISMVMMIGVLLLGVNSFVKLKVRNKIINVEDT